MRILIIEDNKETRQLLKTSLESECFVVDMAEDGEKGSYLARTNDYDLIILDLVLPNKNGQQVCEEIRRAKKTMPIIVLSVRTDVLIKIDLLNMGADDYVIKPFSVKEVIARIRALLRRPRQTENFEKLQLDNLIMDIRKQIVWRDKKEIYLTRKEFILLEYLLKNQGNVVSRAMIMEHVWDINADPFSHTIESHILNLRRKIETDKKKKLIHTVPGRGYKINVSST